jgi:hypothetical protein
MDAGSFRANLLMFGSCVGHCAPLSKQPWKLIDIAGAVTHTAAEIMPNKYPITFIVYQNDCFDT